MLTPMDIHNKDFKRTIRGYSTSEVDEFLDRIVNDYEKLFRENDKLKEQASFNEKELTQYKKMEKSLQDTLMMAQKNVEDITASAQKNAEDITAAAQKSANDMTMTAQRNADELMTTAKRNAEELMSTTNKTVEELKASTERECRSIREQAKLDAERQINEANMRLRAINAEYEKVVRDKNAFLMRIRAALESELAVTNQMLSSVPHQETVKAHSTTMSSPLSSVPLPMIRSKSDKPSVPTNQSQPQPSKADKPSDKSSDKPIEKPSEKPSEKPVDPEELQKTSVFVKSRVK